MTYYLMISCLIFVYQFNTRYIKVICLFRVLIILIGDRQQAVFASRWRQMLASERRTNGPSYLQALCRLAAQSKPPVFWLKSWNELG